MRHRWTRFVLNACVAGVFVWLGGCGDGQTSTPTTVTPDTADAADTDDTDDTDDTGAPGDVSDSDVSGDTTDATDSATKDTDTGSKEDSDQGDASDGDTSGEDGDGTGSPGVLDPSASTLSTAPGTRPADALTAFEVVVELLDENGSPLPGETVFVELAGGPGAIVSQPESSDSEGKAVARVVAIDGGTYELMARVGEGADAIYLTESLAVTFTGCTTTGDYYRRALRGPIFSTCSGCHNAYGLASEDPWKSLSLWQMDDRLDDLTVSTTISTLESLAKETVGADATPKLLAKPTGVLGHEGGVVVVPGTDQHAHLTAFVARLQAGDSCSEPSEDLLAGLTMLSEEEAYYKASEMLVGRAPTATESAGLLFSGSLELHVEATLLNQPAFYRRLQDLYNELLLTDRVMGTFKLLAHLAQADYADRFYFRPFANKVHYNNSNYTCGDPGNGEACCEDVDPQKDLMCAESGFLIPFCKYADSHAVVDLRREALALISYVVRNDKPFTDILTANYTVVNPATARLYGLLSGPNAVTFEDHCDLDDWKPAKLEMDNLQGVTEQNTYPSNQVPHAGVLSTHTFLNRYMTTNTNLNRHRAAMVYQKFLDIDIQGLQSTIVGQDTALPSNPTLAGKSCKVCHAAMDPLAAGFTKWAPNGQVRRGRVAHVCTQFLEGSCAQDSECSTNEICYENKCVNEGYQPDLCVRPIGHRGVQLPANQERAPLRWMAQQLAQDPRFASTTVKTLLGLLTGRAALAAPADPRDPSYGAQTRAYLAQEAEVARVTPVFVDSGYNLKTAITEIVAGPWFRAIDAPAGLSPLTEEGLLAGRVGGGQLLTPEELNARIRDLTGFPWITIAGRGDSLLSAKQGYLTLYGGLDSDTITRRTRDPFPVAANVARRMANEMACLVVPQDLAWLNPDDRRFFAAIDMPPAGLDANFQPMDGLAIEETIEWLHALLLNESAPPGSEAFEETYNLLLTVWQAGRQRVLDGTESANLPARCRATKDYLEGVPFAESSQPGRTAVSDDATYAIRAWMAVVSYLLSDGRFLLH